MNVYQSSLHFTKGRPPLHSCPVMPIIQILISHSTIFVPPQAPGFNVSHMPVSFPKGVPPLLNAWKHIPESPSISSTLLWRRARGWLVDDHTFPFNLLPLDPLTLIKSPHPIGFFGLNARSSKPLCQPVKHRITGRHFEEASPPLPPLDLLLPSELPLRIFNFRFLDVYNVHVALLDAGGDMLPCAVGFIGVLLIERWGDEGGCFGGFGAVAIYCFCHALLQSVASTSFYGEGICPLAFDGVENVFGIGGGG